MTLVAVPTTTVSSVDLELQLPAGATALATPRARFAATAVGAPRLLVVPVRLAVAGADVTGAVRVPGASGHLRMRPALARLGAPAPAAAPRPVRDVLLPTGDRVAEVRP